MAAFIIGSAAGGTATSSSFAWRAVTWARICGPRLPDAIARLRYIKIDTEGFDRSVVASLRDVLQATRPYLRVEIYKHLPSDERGLFFDDLHSLEYRLFKYEDDQQENLQKNRDEHADIGPALTRDAMNRWQHFDLFAVPAERA